VGREEEEGLTMHPPTAAGRLMNNPKIYNMLWPDKETEIDYLNFSYLVDMVVSLSTNRDLSPSTIGLYGDWGSGKSSLMKLAKNAIEAMDKEDGGEESKILCVDFNGWLFEGYDDAKTSLCGTILDALADEKRFGKEVAEYAKDLLKKVENEKVREILKNVSGFETF
jgi:predicted KAP-like P-loop ATPase